MKLLVALGLLFTITLPAFAQQGPPSPHEQAMATKLMQEIQAGLTCSANLIEMRIQLVTAQARVRELELKLTHAPPDAAEKSKE